MGKSAKLHKRTKKPSSGASGNSTNSAITVTNQSARVQAAKKRSGLKTKRKGSDTGMGQGVLGGADYVALMMGGRRKAREEEKKLPT